MTGFTRQIGLRCRGPRVGLGDAAGGGLHAGKGFFAMSVRAGSSRRTPDGHYGFYSICSVCLPNWRPIRIVVIIYQTHRSVKRLWYSLAMPTLRSHSWLQSHFESIWRTHFADVEKSNSVTIEWSKHNRNRLGAITAKGGTPTHPEKSEIRINSLLRNPAIPEVVITQTIAHELAHYAHGFCSPHPQKFRHPHRGRVIEKELVARGLGTVYNEAEAWLKQNWRGHVHDVLGQPKRRTYARLSLLQNLTARITIRRRVGR